MTRILHALLALFVIAASGGHIRAAHAQSAPVVVELFTSQGCSSCPPADALLAELAQDPDILPLSLHVDYWDYIGWPDTFALPQFTARQEAYMRAAGGNRVYTPHMVVGGKDHLIGADPANLARHIRAHQAVRYPVLVRISAPRNGRVFVEALTDAPRPMMVQVIRFLPQASVEIGRGENAGRSAQYHNVVRSWRMDAQWDGLAPYETSLPMDPDLDLAVIVQDAGMGAVLGAARAPR